jgi:hypothetical protein
MKTEVPQRSSAWQKSQATKRIIYQSSTYGDVVDALSGIKRRENYEPENTFASQ